MYRAGPGVLQRREHPDQNAVDRIFARPPQAKTGQGHSYLGHGKQTSGVGQKIECRLRAGITLRGHLAQPRMTHREQRHLCSRKEAVDGDEQNDEQQA